jgi:hypothetical protein
MRAIDLHVHVPRQPGLPEIGLEEAMRQYFRVRWMPENADQMAEKYQEWDVFGVIFSIDSETTTGDPPDSNDYIADIVRKYPEQFMGFATVDPWKGKLAIDELDRSINELGLKGLKLHPIQQAFYPNDTRFYPLYEKCAAYGVPVLFHSGFAASGLGMQGGAGLKLKYGAPIPGIDDVAADFPELTIIMAHPAWPWVDEQIAVLLHKPNVYVDFSGWSPGYIPDALIREANTRLQDKVMFGSDFPFITPERWLSDFDQLDIREEVRPKILLENARRVLGL